MTKAFQLSICFLFLFIGFTTIFANPMNNLPNINSLHIQQEPFYVITAKEVPQIIKTAIRKKYKNRKVTRASVNEDKTIYRLDLGSLVGDEETIRVTCDAKGKILPAKNND